MDFEIKKKLLQLLQCGGDVSAFLCTCEKVPAALH